MTPFQRTLAALRKLRHLHDDTGQVPVVELGLLIAEIEAAEDEPRSDLSDPARRSDLATNPHGYPRRLAR